MKHTLIAPLKQKEYRLFYTVQLFSDLGNWLDFTILTVLITYNWGLDESAMASFIIVYGLPWVIIGPFASVFVDRWPRKKVLAMTLILRIAVVLAYISAPNLVVLLLFVFCKGVFASIFDPARQASIRTLVPKHLLPEAVTLSQISHQTMKIIGPALGGALVAVSHVSIAFIVEALCFSLAAICLIFVSFPNKDTSSVSFDDKKEQDQLSYFQALREGFQHITQNPILSTAIIAASISLFIIFLYDGLIVFVSQLIGFHEGLFGLFVSLVGVGSVIGSLILGQLQFWKQKPLLTMLYSFFGSGFIIALMGIGASQLLQLPIYVWFVSAFIAGILTCGENIPYGYILQVETPAEKMGRVSSAAQSMQTMMMLLAPSLGALLAKKIGVGNVLLLAGCLCFLTSIVMFGFLRAKKLEIQAPRSTHHEKGM